MSEKQESTKPTLHPDGVSRASELLPILPFGNTTLWNWSKSGKFPAPMKISKGVTAWRNSDVLKWLENLESEPEVGGVK